MSDDSRAIVPVGQRGVVASVSQQFAITEKALGRILGKHCASIFSEVSELIDKKAYATKAVEIMREANACQVGSNQAIMFNEELYRQLKPHLSSSWFVAAEATTDKHLALEAFIRDVISGMGRDFLPYAKKFYKEVITDVKVNHSEKAQTKETATTEKLRIAAVVDDIIYAQMKPYFNKKWVEAKAAFQDPMDVLDVFYNEVLDTMGDDIEPYIRTFYREIKRASSVEVTKKSVL